MSEGAQASTTQVESGAGGQAAGGPSAARVDLEGWIPPMASEAEVRGALEKAFDYRGDVTLTLKGGQTIEAYIFDRRLGATLADCRVRYFPKAGGEKAEVAFSEITRLHFTGRDNAAGKSFETWVKKYWEKKAAGEKNIGIESENLD